MGVFEFLIQREGDRSWLPIESSEVEILEGRYRIMGRSPQPNLPIEIRITYLDLESVPPRRRTHKRTSQTNAQGLVAVMPFTSLRNGKWGIQCISPEASTASQANAIAPARWQRHIQLQVLEDTAHHVEDFEPEYASVDPNELVHALSASTNHHELENSEHELENSEIDAPPAITDSEPDAVEQIEAVAQQHDVSNGADITESASVDQPSGLPAFSNMSVDQIEQLLGQLEPDQMLTTVGGASEDEPGDSPQPTLPKDLPIDIDSLSPEIRDDIVNMFQTFDAIAEDILASIGQQLSSTPSQPSTDAPPLQTAKDSSPNPENTERQSGVSTTPDLDSLAELENVTADPLASVDPLASLEIVVPAETDDDDALFTLPDDESPILAQPPEAMEPLQSEAGSDEACPPLQLQLTYDAWTLTGDRSLTLTGTIQSLEPKTNGDPVREVSINRPIQLQVRLTDPHTGESLSDTSHSVTLAENAPLTPFSVSITEIKAAQTTIILGELYVYWPGSQPSPPAATQTFVVTPTEPNELGHELTSNNARSDSRDTATGAESTRATAQPSSPPTIGTENPEHEAKSHSQSPQLPNLAQDVGTSSPSRSSMESEENNVAPPPSFRLSAPKPPFPSSIDKEQPNRSSRPAEQVSGDRPALDLPDFVKSPTSLASSILGLAGLPADALDPTALSPDSNAASEAHSQITTEYVDGGNLTTGIDEADLQSMGELGEQSVTAQSLGSQTPSFTPKREAASDDSQVEQELQDTASRIVDDNEADTAEALDELYSQERVSDLEHAAQRTNHQRSDTQSLAYDDVDPFDLLDDDEALDHTPPYQSSSNLAQQYIPDYSEEWESDPFNDSPVDADESLDEAESSDDQAFDAQAVSDSPSSWAEPQATLGTHPIPTTASDHLSDSQEANLSDAPPKEQETASAQKADMAVDHDLWKNGDEERQTEPPSPNVTAAHMTAAHMTAASSLSALDEVPPISAVADAHGSQVANMAEASHPPNTAPPTSYSVLPDDVEVPTPEIECFDDELIAGQSFFITVKLPKLGPRIFVKLWIQDRHTRTLLDGPRWLADFVSVDDENVMQTKTQLTIPLGAMEVRLEAIAMEMMTQRESYKVSIDKSVLPPDMPFFSLDDL
jgi:hypothetical protein